MSKGLVVGSSLRVEGQQNFGFRSWFKLKGRGSTMV